jgi:hypothetical protein
MPLFSVKNASPTRLAILGGCAVVWIFVSHISGPGPSKAQITQQRAQFTKLRPDLSSRDYWHQRCAPYLDNLAKIEASTYHGWADHEQDFARGAWDVCKENEFIEDNGVGPNIRDIYEDGGRNHHGKGDFNAVDAGLISGPAQAPGSPAPVVHTAVDGCDMAGAIPNCKEQMAKLMGRR